MSQRIAELERAAGVPLVQRTTRSVRFTEAGQHAGRRYAQQYERIATSFASVSRDGRRRARLGAGDGAGGLRAAATRAAAWRNFCARNPEVRVNWKCPTVSVRSRPKASISRSGTARGARHARRVDAVRNALGDARDARVHEAARHAGDAHDLATHDCLLYPRRRNAGIWSFERRRAQAERGPRHGRGERPVRGQQQREVLRDAALDDLGIALLPDFTAQAAIHSGRLVVLLPEWRPVGAFADQLYVVRPYAPHVPRAVAIFVAYLREAFARGFRFRSTVHE